LSRTFSFTGFTHEAPMGQQLISTFNQEGMKGETYGNDD
jgi:hypothetical protein